jgi:hypothetical protein
MMKIYDSVNEECVVINKKDAKKYLSLLEKQQLEFILRSIEISQELEGKKSRKYIIKEEY